MGQTTAELRLSIGCGLLIMLLLQFGVLLVQERRYLSNDDLPSTSPPLRGNIAAISNTNRRPTLYINNKNETSFHGVIPRAFDPWPSDIPIPCFEPEPNWRHEQEKPTDNGLIFVKPYKTGSSTASGIHLRMARNIARRQQARDSDKNYQICKSRFDHATASDLVSDRVDGENFLWTIIRDPSSRIVSHFFHMQVSRQKYEPTVESFLGLIREYMDGSFAHDYYLRTLSTESYEPDDDDDYEENVDDDEDEERNGPVEIANKIMQEYDFIGVTERMDESAVVLAMLLNLPLADVLYLTAKGRGGFDDGGGRGGRRICTYIWPSFVTDEMQKVLDSQEWQDLSRYDRALHQAANKSLDLTIDRLGRETFERNLVLFKEAKETAQTQCFNTTVFPCSEDGNFTPDGQTDCLWNDSGCGYECLDKVSTEMGLWQSKGPLEITEPEGFRFEPMAWCGTYEAKTCSECADSLGKGFCGGDCKWCEYGIKEDENFNLAGNPFNVSTCAPKTEKCRREYPLPPSPAELDTPSYLLDVPFYVYEELLWIGDTYVGDTPMREWVEGTYTSLTEDWWVLSAASAHPMRTWNPKKAKIFVLPTLLNVVLEGLINDDAEELCVEDICGLDLFNLTDDFLKESPWFQRNNGRDHILVASHAESSSFLQFFENIMSCNIIGIPGSNVDNAKWNAPNRSLLPVTHVGRPCKRLLKNQDFVLTESMSSTMNGSETNESDNSTVPFCDWLRTHRKGYAASTCGDPEILEQCPVLGRSRFSFHIRHDSVGLIDALLSGTIPIFTSPTQLAGLPWWIDWEKLSYTIPTNGSDQEAFLSAVDTIAEDESGYQERMSHVLANRDLFTWVTAIPFDTYLYMLSVQLWPELAVKPTNEAPSPYTALSLPTVSLHVPDDQVEWQEAQQ